MADPSFFDPVRLPVGALIALDWRPLHFWMQPVHYAVRAAHIVSASLFYGLALTIDLRLLGWRSAVPLAGFLQVVVSPLRWSFGIACGSGLALFAYDPVHIGSHAYFVPKMLALVLGGLSTVYVQRSGAMRVFGNGAAAPASARIGGAASLLLWTASMVFACMNTEGVPRVFLR